MLNIYNFWIVTKNFHSTDFCVIFLPAANMVFIQISNNLIVKL